MSVRRRDITALAFLPRSLYSASIPLRKPAHELLPEEIALLEKAYDRLQHSNVSLNSFATLHSLHCTGSHLTDVHDQIWFLLWHRIFIYTHELALRSVLSTQEASGFAIPYWDWDTPGRNKVPLIYLKPGPLHRPRLGSPHSVVQPAFPVDELWRCPAFWDLAGLPIGVKAVSFQRYLRQLHDFVHAEVGGPCTPNAPAFSCLPTSAADPLFYAHHANVDRLWSAFQKLPANGKDKDLKKHPPPDPAFQFLAPNGKPLSPDLLSFLNHSQFYSYATVPSSFNKPPDLAVRRLHIHVPSLKAAGNYEIWLLRRSSYFFLAQITQLTRSQDGLHATLRLQSSHPPTGVFVKTPEGILKLNNSQVAISP